MHRLLFYTTALDIDGYRRKEGAMKSYLQSLVMLLLMVVCIGLHQTSPAAQLDDKDALAGVHETKSLFDVNVSEPQELEFYLRVIRKTHDDLVRQGYKPDMIIVFHGPSVRLVNTETWSFSEEDEQLLKKSQLLIKELKALGVRLEACSVATQYYHVDNDTILPEIKVVGNTFISLTGYQSKGYALIPVN